MVMNVGVDAFPPAVSSPLDFMIWGGVVLLALLALGAVVFGFRRKLTARLDEQGQGMSIEKLEELRSGGQISDEEFRILRRAALGLSEAVAGQSDSSLRQPAEDDDESSQTDGEDAPAE